MEVGVERVGYAHSGIDDARSLAEFVYQMSEDDADFYKLDKARPYYYS